MWHLGTDEESHNSIDLTQISVDVRNLPFEDSKVKAALCVCGGLNGLFFLPMSHFWKFFIWTKIILTLYYVVIMQNLVNM